MNQKTLTFTLSLILCCVAFIVRDSFLSFSIAKITGKTVLFNESWKLPYQILPTIVFIFSIGIIPYLYLLIKKTCRINSVQKQVGSAGIIINSGLLFYSLRLVYLKIKASQTMIYCKERNLFHKIISLPFVWRICIWSFIS